LKRLCVGVAAFLFGISADAASFAATVNAVQGQVLISHGQGYQPVIGSAHANPGDTVVANPGGSAQIVYSAGCTVPVQPGSIVTVASQSPCNSGPAPAAGSNALAIGAVAVGGTLAGVGIGALINAQRDKPASP
jgi:hypothetical protein